MPQPSEQSMNTAKSLGDFVKKPDLGPMGGNGGSPVDLLGQIYGMMLKVQEEQDIDHELSMKEQRDKDKKENDRNAALIKVLTARRKPKAKKPPKKKEEPKKEEPKKPEEKKEEPKKPEEKKVEEKVKKDQEASKKKAEKETKDAKDKADKEAAAKKKTAEEKPVEAKPPKAEPVPKPAGVKPPPSATKTTQELGKLSSKFETGGRKNSGAVVGWDSTGGTSYGTYQIAAKVGTMAAFLKFAEAKGETDIVSRLKSAGPADTGSNKGPFVDEWKKISAEKGKEFEKLQHDFIEDSQYKPAAKTLLKVTGYDIEQQSAAIKDVFFSTVVQHGPGGANGIFKKAIQDNGGPNADPKNIINSVYEIRGTKFGSSTEKVRKSVQDRFIQEKSQALDMLKNDGNNLNQSSKENAELNANLEKQQQSTTVNNVDNSTTQQPAAPIKDAKVDDRSAMQRKMQGQ